MPHPEEAGPDAVPIGMEFEKSPAPSSVPVLYVVQPFGFARLVVVSKV